MYKFMTEQLEHECNLNVSERQKETNQLIEDKVIVPVRAGAFARRSKRKPKETFSAYRRSLRNARKALKARLRGGANAQVFINKETMEII